jgi:hypothetical protein
MCSWHPQQQCFSKHSSDPSPALLFKCTAAGWLTPPAAEVRLNTLQSSPLAATSSSALLSMLLCCAGAGPQALQQQPVPDSLREWQLVELKQRFWHIFRAAERTAAKQRAS